MIVHDLKTHPAEFAAIKAGIKHFEIRDSTDRDFQQGDTLVLKEFDPTKKSYTGNQIVAIITYIVRGGQWGLPANLVCMSIMPYDASSSPLPITVICPCGCIFEILDSSISRYVLNQVGLREFKEIFVSMNNQPIRFFFLDILPTHGTYCELSRTQATNEDE